ncbi:MAG TPA: glycosyltransferase [Pirellulaceae bacterium]|nr:glycosyltransferase [Pirellulaceae bacterium]
MASHSDSLVILIPNFNDWEPLQLLLNQLDTVAAGLGWCTSVLVVDDASTLPMPANWPQTAPASLVPIEVLHLRANLGHQRAIALGLYHINETRPGATVVVMDGDGEDRAADILALLAEYERSGRRDAIFAARAKRMESFVFQFFYQLYRLLHRALTGIEVRVGNFSVLPPSALARLMAVSDLWNHYAAAVLRARLPRRLLPLARGNRLAGNSQMNFTGLLVHGLSAISVFSDHVSARLLTASAVLGVAVTALATVATAAWSAGIALPDAVIYGLITLAAITVQSLLLTAFFVFLIAHRRATPGFLLPRDARHFILGVSVAGERSSLELLAAALHSATVHPPATDQTATEVRK